MKYYFLLLFITFKLFAGLEFNVDGFNTSLFPDSNDLTNPNWRDEYLDFFDGVLPPLPEGDVNLPGHNVDGDDNGINDDLIDNLPNGPFPIVDVNETYIENPIIPSDSSSVDSDDDVPMLTNIYSRLANLDQDDDVPTLQMIHNRMKKLNEDTRDYRFDVATDTESSQEYTTLQDLHIELQKIRILSESNSSELNSVSEDLSNEVDEQSSAIDSGLEDLDKKILGTKITVTKPELDKDSHFVDVPEVLQPILKTSNIDLFNADGSLPIPKLSDVAKFVSLVIGLVAVFIYSQAVKKLLARTLDILTTSNESNTVTNYSVLGNSVGALGVKAIKMGLSAALVVSVLVALGLVLVETLNLELGDIQFTGKTDNIITSIVGKLSSFGVWSQIAVHWFFKFVPIVSLLYMCFQYWLASYGIKGLVFAQNRALRIAS
jgi:hypothetical protein